MKKTIVAVLDGKGGGLGKMIVEILSPLAGDRFTLVAAGTNAQATRVMLAAGAQDGSTGENALCYIASRADIIVAPIAFLIANGMMGEISPTVAAAVSASSARKLLIPTERCGVHIIGLGNMTMKDRIAKVQDELLDNLRQLEDELR